MINRSRSGLADRPGERDLALDAVRGVAIVAMVVAHTAAYLRPTAPETILRIESVLADLASPLFALVIGVTVVLTGPPAVDPTRRRVFQRQFALKGLALVPIGWLLSVLPSGVDAILDPLGVTILLAAPLVFLRSRVLVGVTAALCVVGPLLTSAARSWTVGHRDVPGGLVTAELLDWFVLGHNYRVTGLLPLLLLGVLLGRFVPGRPRRLGGLLVLSMAAFLGAQLARPLGFPNAKLSGTHVDLVRDIGLAGATYAVVLLAVGLIPRLRRVWEPFAVQGRLALSVYVGHVAVLTVLHTPWMSTRIGPQLAQPIVGWSLQLGLVLLCLVAAAAWWATWRTGPVERLVGLASGRGRSVVS